MGPMASRLHLVAAKCAAALAGVGLLLTLPAAADTCTQRSTASLSSRSSFGLGSLSMTFDQSARMERVAPGPGTEGAWIVTEWSVVTTLPVADPMQRPGTMFMVPEWQANCTARQLSPLQYEHACTGEIPILVSGGAISWTAGGDAIGRISAPAGSSAPSVTLNILPNGGGFNWTMAGTVATGKAPTLSAEITGARMVSQPSGFSSAREYTIFVTVDSATTALVQSLDASKSYSGKRAALITMTKTATRVIGGTWALKIWNQSPAQRAALVKLVTVSARVDAGGCKASANWPLDKLLFVAGITP
jgi:hypothetical protein